VESGRDEDRLMAAYARGDACAFRALYGILGPKLHGFFLRSFADRDQADDLLQTTFLKLHQARGDYQPGRPVRPWVFTIASRVRFDELRRRARRPVMLDVESQELVARTEDLEAVWQLRRALEDLPANLRSVVVLHGLGLTFREIGALLGASEGAVRLRSFRAIRRLRRRLAPGWWATSRR
jgi:RNA polymerase sigma-70 factor (ECF subfamily)